MELAEGGHFTTVLLFIIFALMKTWIFCTLLLLLGSCSSRDPIREHYLLVNHRGQQLSFPAEFRGQHLLVSFIYTHCPDMCPATVNNVRKISSRPESGDVQFVMISFDPERDSVAALDRYAEAFGITGDSRWQLLTGEEKTVRALMKHLGVRTRRTNLNGNAEAYELAHSDMLLLIDPSGTVREEYEASRVEADEVLEDLSALRAEHRKVQ